MILRVILTTLAFLLISCSSTVYRLKMDEKNKTWKNGIEFSEKEIDNKNVKLAYLKSSGDQLYFLIEVKNNSNKKAGINPTDFFYVIESKQKYDQPRARISDKRKIYKVKAIDPENVLLDIDKKIEDNKTSYAVHDLSTSLANLITSSDDYYEDERNIRDEYQFNKHNLQEMRSFWEKNTLRRTELSKNESVKGIIVFPALETESKMNIYYKNTEKSFSFLQKKY